MAFSDPLVIQIMRRQKALLIARDDTGMRRMGREWLTFERDLQGRMEALAQEVLRAKERGLTANPDKVAELSRYRSLMRDVHRELRKYTAWVEGEITSEQRERIWQGTEDANDAIRAAGFHDLVLLR